MRRIKVAYGRTFNIGNYESIRIDVGVEEDVPNGEDINKASNRMLIFCRGKVLNFAHEEGADERIMRNKKRGQAGKFIQDPQICTFCGKPRVVRNSTHLESYSYRQLVVSHINVCQTPSIHMFCSKECMWNWCYSNPKSHPNTFRYKSKGVKI